MLSVRDLTKAINEFTNSRYKLKNDKMENFIRARTNAQISYEKDILLRNKICSSSEKNHLEYIEGIRNNLGSKLQKNFFDYELMESFRCSVDIIFDDNSSDDETVTKSDRIKNFIKRKTKFGTESVSGVAIRASIKSEETTDPDMFVMKVPRNIQKSNEMIHEVIVGLEGTNELRKVIPNFSYTFDAFSYSYPVINGNKDVVQWGIKGTKPIEYALYENIDNAIPIGDVKTPEELTLAYIQCLLALKIANEKCDFTHYDCHHENVLMRKYSDNDFYIPYMFNGNKLYLKTKGRVATFIDYGMSHIQTKDGTHIGILDTNCYFFFESTYSDVSNIIGDAYKLICMLLYVNFENIELSDEIFKILGYFFGKDMISESEAKFLIEHQFDHRFTVDVALTNQWDFTDLINHCINMAMQRDSTSVIYTKPPNTLESINSTIVESENEISDFKIDFPSPFDIYESKGDKTLVSKFKQNEDVILEKTKNDLSIYLNYVYEKKFYAIPSERYQIENKLEIFTHSIVKVAKLIEMYDELQNNIKYLNSVIPLSNKFIKLLQEVTNKKNELHNDINEIRQIINSGASTLMNIVYGTENPSKDKVKQATNDKLFDITEKYKMIKQQLLAI